MIARPLRAEAVGKPFVSSHAVKGFAVVCLFVQVATECIDNFRNVAGDDCPFTEELVGNGDEFVVHTSILSVIM